MITYLIVWEQIQSVLEWLLNTYYGWVGNWGWAIVLLTVTCLLYTSPSPRDRSVSRMPSSA